MADFLKIDEIGRIVTIWIAVVGSILSANYTTQLPTSITPKKLLLSTQVLHEDNSFHSLNSKKASCSVHWRRLKFDWSKYFSFSVTDNIKRKSSVQKVTNKKANSFYRAQTRFLSSLLLSFSQHYDNYSKFFTLNVWRVGLLCKRPF